nr:hypothetical protein [uncultured Cohaesibacter sp.]
MIRIIFAALLLLSGPALAEECSSEDGRYHLTIDGSSYAFEAIENGSPVWAFDTEYGCSQGIPFCGITLDTSKGPYDLPVEFVKAANGEKFVVISQASQSLASSYMRVPDFDVEAERQPGHEQDEINIPNVFICE